MTLTRKSVAKMLDHAVLRPNATAAELASGCKLACELGLGAICVRPADLPETVRLIAGSDVTPCTVIGFPHGAIRTQIKADEAALAIDDGATELDMVINIGRLIDGDVRFVGDEIAAVVRAAQGKLVKVIFECCYLTNEQIISACRATIDAGANFVKTSTGFGSGGATIEHVRLMRQQVGPNFGVKASGGIKTLDDIIALAQAGANRIGTSSSSAIMQQAAKQLSAG